MIPSNITVMVLGAGVGSRLRPLTDRVPKVMIPIAENLPLLEHTLLLLKKQGFRDFVINIHYLPDFITNYLGDGSKFGISIHYSDERNGLLDTAGAIKFAEPYLSDPFVLMYGDQLHFFDAVKLINFFEDHPHALGAVVLKRSDHPQNGDLAEIDPVTLRIIGWHRRPHAFHEFCPNMYLNTGIYVFRKNILARIPANKSVKLDGDIIPAIIAEQGLLYGFVVDEDILDIGTPEKYEYAKRWHAEHS